MIMTLDRFAIINTRQLEQKQLEDCGFDMFEFK